MEIENSVDTLSQDANATSPEAQETPATESIETPEAPETEAQPTQSEQEELTTVKVNGREIQLNRQDLVKYAQLGHASQSAFQKAAETEKKAKGMYEQLVKAAQTDVFGLYQVLTGQVHPLARQATQTGAGKSDEPLDPRDQQLNEYREKLSAIEARLEQEDIAREQKAIEQELDDAVTKWPVLNTPAQKAFVKSQYRAALTQGLDTTLEDVAFYCAQAEKQRLAEAQKLSDQKIREANKRAPVVTAASQNQQAKKPMSLEDVKKLAGRI